MANRVDFGKLTEIERTWEPPDLIEVQRNSYRDFLQMDVTPNRRKKVGLQAVFEEVFPIRSYDKKFRLSFVRYEIGDPSRDWLEALSDGETFSAPLNVIFRLDEGGKEGTEEKVYMGEVPLMTEPGSFVINGAERVIVSQLHRSPGICFEQNIHPNGSVLYSFRIIPDRGSWVEVQFDSSDNLHIYLDRTRRRRKFLASTFLRALGYDGDEDLLSLFYVLETLDLAKGADEAALTGRVLRQDVTDPASQQVIGRRYETLTADLARQILAAGVTTVSVVNVTWDEGVLLKSIQKDPTHSTEEALKDIYTKIRPGDPPTSSNARQLLNRLFFDPRRYDLSRVGRYKISQKLRNEIEEVEALIKAVEKRRGKPVEWIKVRGPDDEDEEGRARGEADEETRMRVLSPRGVEILAAIRYLKKLRQGDGMVDDIDHLGSRRIRTVGELLENACRQGLARTERLVRERMTIFDTSVEKLTPQKLVNPKALSAVIRDFFGRSQLSQFMDQTNPLSELTHKRRLSALGPGGLNRDRAGFEVRDVHSSHYGRICPIETPEGPNIGLISSLSIYARVNDFGFIQTPYRKVKDGRVTDEVEHLTADQEESYVIAQANAQVDAKGRFTSDKVSVRSKGDFKEVPPSMINYMDLSPKQLVSVAAGLIPFLEHDDANRALMGSNMQRQGVPLLVTERPFVATGLEARVARDSRITVLAEQAGKVASVTADKVIVSDDGELPGKRTPADQWREYRLRKFMRSNAGTCVNQKPVVRVGQRVKKGDVLADGPATDQGELALGRNVVVAFMPWCGYNFEDAIIINERLVREDVYTSIHIEEFECGARDTKLGPEEITRDIPNVGEEALKNLNHDGVIRVGAEVKPGDILVGKITPKSETELAPEERLLRAIFGEKAADVRDTSLTVPSGTYGIVMEVKVSARRDQQQAKLSPVERRRQRKQMEEDHENKREALYEELTEALSNILLGEKIPLDVINGESGEVLIPANRKITKTLLRKLARNFRGLEMEPSPIKIKITEITGQYEPKFDDLEIEREREMERLDSGDDIDAGIIKQVKVYVASKKKLSVGDKMAGRHGNKGVIARIVPDQDMPFLPDGTPVDVALNPLGVPSRMNVGQVLETHLGWACRVLGLHVATPVFDGISEERIREKLREARKTEAERRGWHMDKDGTIFELRRRKDENGRSEEQRLDRNDAFLGEDGKTTLVDGRTGEPFDQRVMVGCIYMMKLHHLVSDKIHARAVGPYSLVTQQPLGGKAQYGGQRFGEMEVWAMEAYGAAYALQELLTVKSDDVAGRTRIYESIVKGENTLDAGMPESFNVLMKEMQSLALDIRVNRTEV